MMNCLKLVATVLFVGLSASRAHAGSIVITVTSLHDILLSKDSDETIKANLARNGNMVDVTVTNSETGVVLTDVTTGDLLQKKKFNPDLININLENGPLSPVSVNVVIECPGQKKVTLNGVYNIDDTKNSLKFVQKMIVVMPLDKGSPSSCDDCQSCDDNGYHGMHKNHHWRRRR